MLNPRLRNTAAAALLLLTGIGMSGKVEYPALERRGTGIEIVARFSSQPKYVTVAPDGRILFTQYDYMTDRSSLLQLLPDGKTKPFPSPEWSGKMNGRTGFADIVGIYCDPGGYVIVADRGDSVYPPKVVAINTVANDKIDLVRELPKRKKLADRFIQDLAFDARNRIIYLAACNKSRTQGALIQVRFPHGNVRVIPIDRSGFGQSGIGTGTGKAQPGSELTYSVTQGVNVPISVDPKSEWLYMGTLTGKKIWRIQTSVLADANLSNQDIVSKFEEYADKPISSHMVADASGNVYVTDEGQNAIGIASKEGGYRWYRKDSIMNWPDDICLGLDGNIYVTVNQIRKASTSRTASVGAQPFMIVRTKAGEAPAQ